MIDKTILDNAQSIDLITFLERYKGFHFRFLSGEYRPTEHTSLAIKSDRLSWYWHSKGIGGYTRLELPSLKDYNEVLLQYRSKQKKQKRLEGIYER